MRTAIEPEHTASAVRAAVGALDPNLPIRDLKTMETQLDENTFAERLLTTLTVSFAALATLLASIGLYGVLAYNVARRTREIGIRMALGANSRDVRKLVLRQVGWMLMIATVTGLSAAAASAKFVQSFLYGLKPWNIWIYGSASLVLWIVAFAAAYIPTRRAAAVDPMVALRYE